MQKLYSSLRGESDLRLGIGASSPTPQNLQFLTSAGTADQPLRRIRAVPGRRQAAEEELPLCDSLRYLETTQGIDGSAPGQCCFCFATVSPRVCLAKPSYKQSQGNLYIRGPTDHINMRILQTMLSGIGTGVALFDVVAWAESAACTALHAFRHGGFYTV